MKCEHSWVWIPGTFCTAPMKVCKKCREFRDGITNALIKQGERGK